MNNPIYELSSGIRHLSIASIFAKSCGLLNTSILLIFLTRTDYGLLALSLSFFGIANFVSGFSQGEVVVSYFSRTQGLANLGKGETLLRSFYLFCILGSIATTILICLVIFYSGVSSSLTSSALGIGLLCVLLTPLRNMIYVHFQSREAFDRIQHLEITQNTIQTSSYMLFMFTLGLNLTGIFIAYALSRVIPAFLLSRSFRKELRAAIRKPSVRPMLTLLKGEGKFVIARGGVVTAESSARPWLILILLGTEAVALFEAAKTIIGISNDVMPMKQVLLPMISRSFAEPKRMKTLYEIASRYGTLLYGIGGITVILLSPFVFTYIFPKYLESIPLIQIMSVNLFIVGFAVPQTSIFFALGQQAFLLGSATLSLFLLFALGIPFMLSLGITGMAIAFVASGAITVWVRYCYIIRIKPEMTIEWRNLFRYDKEDFKFLSTLLLGLWRRPA